MPDDSARRGPPLAGEVAIVTGASSGIGAATAAELARRGSKVVLAARRVDALDRQARSIQASGREALVVAADLADGIQAGLLADRAEAAFGRIDILVNCAGANWHSRLDSSVPDSIAHLVAVNLLGAMLLTRAVLPGMLERSHGTIISVGSLSGRVAMEPVYSATKYGLRGFSLALRRQLAGSGVTASLVSPGKVRTAMTSHLSERMSGPELVAAAIADLVRRPRRELVVPRRHYAIALLEQDVPWLADRLHYWRHWGAVRQEEPTAWKS